jgi:hypothetical protein
MAKTIGYRPRAWCWRRSPAMLCDETGLRDGGAISTSSALAPGQKAAQEVIVKNPEIRRLIRGFTIELVVYAALVVGYFFLVLRLLGDPLERLFSSHLTVYAFVSLGLIVAQGVLLETVTSFVIGLLGLDKYE